MIGTLLAGSRFMGAGKLVASRWREIGLAVLLAIVVYQNTADTRWVLWADTIPYLRVKLAEQSVELDLTIQANQNLTLAIEERNKEIQRWADVSSQLEQNTAILQDKIDDIEIKANSRVRTVIQEVTPESCTAAFEYLRDSIPELNYDDLLTSPEGENLP